MVDLFATEPHRMHVLSMGAILVLGGLAHAVGRHLHVPSLLFLLLFGILLGPHGLGLVQPDFLGEGFPAIVSIAVALILFDGAMMLDLAQLRGRFRALVGLVGLGPCVTFLLSGLAIVSLLKFPVPVALLAACLLTLSGPTVLLPLLRELPLQPGLRALLEAESVLVSAAGVLVTSMVFHFLTVRDLTFASGLLEFGRSVAVGCAMGAAAHLVLERLLRRLPGLPEDVERLLILGSVVTAYATTEILAPRAGIVQVAVMGVLVGRCVPQRRARRQFSSDLTLIAISLAFVLLAANLDVGLLLSIGWPALLVVAILMLAIRPLAVLAGTAGCGMSLKEKAFVAWLGPRGIVTASMAALTEMQARAAGIRGAEALDELLLLAVLLTVFVQAGTARQVGLRLGLVLPEAEGVPGQALLEGVGPGAEPGRAGLDAEGPGAEPGLASSAAKASGQGYLP